MTEHSGDVSLRDYTDAQFANVMRIQENEAHEWEATAQALRNEHQAAMHLAAEEREKAASIIRQELTRATLEGDERLREHMSETIKQIEAALVSADKLEQARIGSVEAQVVAAEKQTAQSFAASEKAIEKAEAAQKDYNSRSNEFRAALDDAAKHQLPRAEAETRFKGYDEKFDDMRREIAGLRESRSLGSGVNTGVKEAKADRNTSDRLALAVAGFAVAVVLGLAGFVVARPIPSVTLAPTVAASATAHP